MKKRILSGLQPTGDPHLGNYFGAIKQQIELQDEGDAFYFIADFHALTSVRNADALRDGVRKVAATYLALGLDPDKATFFRQSDVPEVQELTFMLECTTGMGVLQRAHSYKDKVANGLTPNVGLFCYPALMAADILIYKSNLVPVGQDQVQHIEICKDMAQSFNAAFNTDVLILPDYRLSETPKVPGTDGRKMSKSYNNTIPIFAEGKELRRSVMGIVTDSKDPRKDPLDPTSCNAYAIYELLVDTHESVYLADRYRRAPESGFPGYGLTKELILHAMEEYFGPRRAEYKRLLAPESELDDILREGGKKARTEAQKTLEACRRAVGLR
ncbi:MAG: tryptophan--tRNA ligase [Acidiferrobacterales bacterium]|nr:tryptophan--tRNA ligase [Acidiferrobacterales bacterium]